MGKLRPRDAQAPLPIPARRTGISGPAPGPRASSCPRGPLPPSVPAPGRPHLHEPLGGREAAQAEAEQNPAPGHAAPLEVLRQLLADLAVNLIPERHGAGRPGWELALGVGRGQSPGHVGPAPGWMSQGDLQPHHSAVCAGPSCHVPSPPWTLHVLELCHLQCFPGLCTPTPVSPPFPSHPSSLCSTCPQCPGLPVGAQQQGAPRSQ